MVAHIGTTGIPRLPKFGLPHGSSNHHPSLHPQGQNADKLNMQICIKMREQKDITIINV